MKISEFKLGDKFHLLGQKDQIYIKIKRISSEQSYDSNAVHLKTGTLDYVFKNTEVQLI